MQASSALRDSKSRRKTCAFPSRRSSSAPSAHREPLLSEFESTRGRASRLRHQCIRAGYL